MPAYQNHLRNLKKSLEVLIQSVWNEVLEDSLKTFPGDKHTYPDMETTALDECLSALSAHKNNYSRGGSKKHKHEASGSQPWLLGPSPGQLGKNFWEGEADILFPQMFSR